MLRAALPACRVIVLTTFDVTDIFTGVDLGFMRRTIEGGGSHLLAAGCHAVDALRWLSGREAVTVSALQTHFTEGYEWPTSILVNLALDEYERFGVLLADIWQWTPFMVLIMLAGLRALPKDPFEAAAIDGASATQAFFRLTLPLMSRIIALAVLIRGVDLFRIYDYVKVMTDGGPGTATETLTAYAGTIYFKDANFPYASTVALLTLILLIVTANIFIKLFRVRF